MAKRQPDSKPAMTLDDAAAERDAEQSIARGPQHSAAGSGAAQNGGDGHQAGESPASSLKPAPGKSTLPEPETAEPQGHLYCAAHNVLCVDGEGACPVPGCQEKPRRTLANVPTAPTSCPERRCAVLNGGVAPAMVVDTRYRAGLYLPLVCPSCGARISAPRPGAGQYLQRQRSARLRQLEAEDLAAR
jgi:hypothetical protein